MTPLRPRLPGILLQALPESVGRSEKVSLAILYCALSVTNCKARSSYRDHVACVKICLAHDMRHRNSPTDEIMHVSMSKQVPRCMKDGRPIDY